MRVAVLSLMESIGADPGALRGYLPIGGRSVLRHQIGLAVALGARRIVVLAEGISGELVALQHVAEAGGAQFHVVATARALVPLLAPEDDVIVLGDGLLAMPDAVSDAIENGPVVLTLPGETAVPMGFERIDLNHAFASVMRIPGRIAAGLADLPAEWNAQSALLRLAVQARVTQRGVPAAMLEDGRWNIVRGEDEAHNTERLWLRLHTGLAGKAAVSPGQRLAIMVVRRFGPALLHAGTRPALVGLAAGVVGLLAAGLGWLGNYALAFALMGAAWLVERVASLLGQVERDSLLASGLARRGTALFHALIDAGLVALAAWRSELPDHPAVPPGAGAFAPVLLLIGVRLVSLVLAERPWAQWIADRLLLSLMLSIASALLPFDASLAVAVVALFAVCLAMLHFGAPGHSAAVAAQRVPNLQLTDRP